MRDIERQRHEIERGHILTFLATAGFRLVTPKMLRSYLFYRHDPVMPETLEFHLRFLANEDFIELVEEQPDPLGPKVIAACKITNAGLNYLDRVPPTDPGVMV